MSVKVSYKLRHKPSGLFYKPVSGSRLNKSNLSAGGKLYYQHNYPKLNELSVINISHAQCKTHFPTKYSEYMQLDEPTFNRVRRSRELTVGTNESDWEVVHFNFVETGVTPLNQH